MLIKKKLLNQNQNGSNINESEVLRADNAPDDGFHSDKENLTKEAQNILNKAKQEASIILQQASEEAEKILYSAEDRTQAGIKEAIEQKIQKLDELEKLASDELKAFGNLRREVLEDSKEIIISVATELASKIINHQIKNNTQIREHLFEQAVQEILGNSIENNINITLIINPEDSEIAKTFAEKMEQNQNGHLEIFLKEDKNIAIGSCLIESPAGILDLNFNSQLQLFKEKMLSSNF